MNGPVPMSLTAATWTKYCVDGVSPEIVTFLATPSTKAAPSTTSFLIACTW